MSESKNGKSDKNYDLLKEEALRWGASLFGVADVSDFSFEKSLLDKDVLDGLVYGISLGVRMSRRILHGIKNQPTKLYFYHYRRVNITLDQLAIMVTNMIQSHGFDALPISSSQTVDWDNQRGHVSHRDIGVQAGLGWVGRNNLLVHPEFGSMVRYVTVFTDMPLRTDKPLNEDCGGCRKCMSTCPAGAIQESSADFKHIGCYDQLREFSKKCHIKHYICGICVKVCSGRKKVRG